MATDWGTGDDAEITVDGAAIEEMVSVSWSINHGEVNSGAVGRRFDVSKAGKARMEGSIVVNRMTDPVPTGQAGIVPGTTASLVIYPRGNTSGQESLTTTIYIKSEEGGAEEESPVRETYAFNNNAAIVRGVVV